MLNPKQAIQTNNAPQPGGTYSQAIKSDSVVYLAGQIALPPGSDELVAGDIEEQLVQIFKNLAAIAEAAGGSLSNIVKLTVYLSNFNRDYPLLNQVMPEFFREPYPVRTTVGVTGLPKGALVEIDAILVLEQD